MSEVAAGAAVGAGVGSVVPVLGTAVGAGIGALGGGILDWMGQSSANQMNEDQFQSNQDFNKMEIQNAQDYNTKMSNTAHQREMADLKAAGLNPILAANQGASTPTAPISNPGTGAPIQNASAGLGRAIGGTVNSAVNAANAVSDIANTNADTTLKQAQALTEATQQERNTWSARSAESDIQLKAQEYRNIDNARDAMIAENKAREAVAPSNAAAQINRNRLDLKNDATDRLLNQIKTGSQAASSAMDAVTSVLPTKAITKNIGSAYSETTRGIGFK